MEKISLQSSYSFLITTLILLASFHQSYCCNYNTYNDALIPIEHPISTYTIDPLNNENFFSFGFWSLGIPQQTFKNYPQVVSDYLQSMPQDGQLLFLIQGKQQNLVLGYIYMNMLSKQVIYKVVLFGNPNQIIEFPYTPVQFEEEWILSLFTIKLDQGTFTVEMTGQIKQSRSILNGISYERIIIGGQGYIGQGFNLNIFNGRLSKIHMSYQIDDIQNKFKYMSENCKIPLPQEGQQTVYFIKGLKIFEGSSSLLYTLNQFGNRFCLSGWVKYDASRIVTYAKYNLIRMSLFKNYNFQTKYGDEIFQMLTQINKANPKGTYVSVIADDRLMPIMGKNDYNIIIQRVALFSEYSYRHFIGLQQWHFIKYEYGSKLQGKRSSVQIQFFNDLGLKEITFNNISPINSPFYINIGADDFQKDILQASIFDFKFEYNYEDDKQILFKACHYSCQTCRGPLENNCITCNSQSHRYYLEEISKCECQQGYINVVDESNCVDFSQIFPLIKTQEVLHYDEIQCQFGYFILPNIGFSAQCVKCPQSNFLNLLCVDCLYSPYTWYLKPICKFDLISAKESLNNAFSYVERDQINYDLYLVDNQGEINLHKGILDFCEMESDSPDCFKAAHKHLNQTIFIKCKPNYFQFNGNCMQVNPYCLKASIEGKCLQYQNGMYWKNDQLYQCPNNCELCYYNKEIQNPYCQQCKENFTLDNGQCIQCGNYCKVCQKYYDPINQNSYFRCYKCLDDSKYFISFDAINCQQNTIKNCIYAFQTLSNNFQINTLDVSFKPRNDWNNIKISCALCNLQYGVILDQSLCISMHEVTCQFSVVQKIVDIPMDDNIFYTILDYDYYTTPSGEQITFGFLDDGNIILTSYQYCIISERYFVQQDIEVVQFTEKCSGNVKYCEVCLKDRTYIWGVTYDCLECEKGYYADRVSGKCYQCPQELNCYKCQSQQKLYKDRWKNNVRAFYNVVIQKNTEHTFRQYGQSDNYDDYEIVCSECQIGYELRNDKCILACPESCLECQYINDQNQCIKCPKNQKGRKLSLSQNQCIDCPQNCSLCRLRSKDEIRSINPLFDNNDYISYTYQCLKSFNDAEYYYEQEQGIFIQCSKHQYCNYEFILTFNLYCSELDYESALISLSSQYEQNLFKQQNLLLSDLISGNSFKEFEKDLFYQQANQISIRTIILNISSVKEQICKIPSNGIIQQIFSKNIFTTINVEITMNFNNNTIIEFEKPLKFLNFNKITIQGAILHPIINDKLKQIIFDSVFPQTILLQHIVYQQLSNVNDQSAILFNNVKNLVLDNFKIIGLVQNEIQKFIEISETLNQKSITFLNFQLINSFLQNQITIFCHLNKNDTINIDNLIVNSKFNNSTLIKTGQQQQFGLLQMNNANFEINVLDCLFFLNLYSLRQIKIKQMKIENSDIQNSTLVILNNNNNIDNFIIQLSRFRENSQAIMNSNQLSLDKLLINLSNIILQLNEYHQSTKFISFQKYNNNQSYIEINQFKIINNYISQNTPDKIMNIQYSALIYLQLDIITIVDLELVRGYGLIDLSINNVQKLKIKSIRISQGHQYKFLGLHQFMDCQLQQVKGESYLQSLFISSVIDLEIEDLIIRSAQTYNSPILYYKSSEKIKQQQFEIILLSDVIIESNLLLLTNQKFQTAILFFESVQETTLQFSNITFYGNVLHEYLQNNLQTSALLLNLNCILGTIIISDTIFNKNIVLNSTDSIIYIKSEKLLFHNCTFSENSLFNYAILQPYLLWGFLDSQAVYQKELSQIFRVKSQSGNGKLLVEHLDIQFCIFEQSIGYSGGALLIEAQKNSIINIVNSQFSNISTEFQRELGFGGSIFLDGTSSQSLNVSFQELIIQNIQAQEQGGFLYIMTGTSQVQIYLNKLTIQNVYAKIGSIIYATFSALQQSSQQIEFNEISIKNTQEEFINYLNQYTLLSKSEEILLINNRVLFFINFAQKVRFTNIKIENIFLESALSIFCITEISIQKLIISNSLINSNLIKISANTYQNQILQLSDIQISNITTVFKQTSYNCELNYIEEIPIQFVCIQQSAPINLIEYFRNRSITYGECILSLIKEKNDQIIIDDINQGLIQFLDLIEQTTIKLYQIELVRINCKYCLKGLIYFNFQKITKLLQKQYLANIMISNSICGRQGCINIEKSNINKRRLLQTQEKYIQQLQLEFLIDNYLCQYNSGINGTCLYISNVKVEMQNCLFQYNQAYQTGGAVYIQENEDILIINSWILNNQAKIGGGLYFENSHDLNYQGLQTKISNNSATFYGNDIVSIPQKLTLAQFDKMTLLETVEIKENDNLLIEQVQQITQQIPFINYIRLPSGQKIFNYVKFNKNTRSYEPLNQIFRIIAQSRNKQIMKNLRNTFCTIESRKLNLSNNNNNDDVVFSNNLTNIQKVLFNESTQDYNLDDLIVYFDNKLPSNIVLQLQFWCNSISIPIYNKEYPYNILNKHSNYKLRVNIKTYDCQYGEIKNYTDFSCIPCNSEQALFSLTINSQKCELKDDISTISVQSALLNLKPGYWRPYFETNKINYCINKPENCLGGWIEGDLSCLKGHIGALCEECDLYAIKEEGPFSTSSKYSCVSCQETSRNFILISFVTLWTLISIFISVQSNLRSIKQSIRVTSILLIKIAAIQNRNQSAVLIKMLTNYLQIMASIATFKLKLPIEFQSTINTAGSPVQTMTYSMDCFLSSLFSFEIQYARMIWQIIMPFVYISFFFTCYLLAIKFKFTSYNKSVITTTIIYMYICLQTSLVGGFAQLISYRNISGYQWIQANVSQRFDTPYHYQWILQFCLPMLIILSIVIPSYFLYGLRSNSANLDKNQVKSQWGYLYNEYTYQAYFWELIKIAQKQLMMICLIYYDDNVILKATMIALIIGIYLELSLKYKPYNRNQLNKLDCQTMNVCLATIILAAGIYISEQTYVYEVKIPYFVLIAIMNISISYILISKIVVEYFKKAGINIEKIEKVKQSIRQHFPFLNQIPFISKLLEDRREQRKRIQQLYMKLKQFLLPQAKEIIAFKMSQLKQDSQRNLELQIHTNQLSLRSLNHAKDQEYFFRESMKQSSLNTSKHVVESTVFDKTNFKRNEQQKAKYDLIQKKMTQTQINSNPNNIKDNKEY